MYPYVFLKVYVCVYVCIMWYLHLQVSPSRLDLRSRVEVPGPPLLFGATIPLPMIGIALGRLCCDTLLGLQSRVDQHQTLIAFLRTQPITSTVLIMVSCLLGGEHRFEN